MIARSGERICSEAHFVGRVPPHVGRGSSTLADKRGTISVEIIEPVIHYIECNVNKVD
jgi:hypothetical protein